MRKISDKIKKEINSDPFYQTCCIADRDCEGRIEMHHNFIYAGRQVDELWAILPVCQWHHYREKSPPFCDLLDAVMIRRMKDEDFRKYNRFDWARKIVYLITKLKIKLPN